MKTMLRAVLFVDAIITLIFGLLFLASPWASLYSALQLVAPQPALVGQLFGVALLGLAWLQWHATISGLLTVTVARVVGHVNWICAVLMLVWLLALHNPALSGLGQFIGPAVAVVLLVIGLGEVRLAGAVRRRERALAVGAESAERAEQRAAHTRTEPSVVPRPVSGAYSASSATVAPTVVRDGPVEPVVEPLPPDAPRRPFHD